MIIVIDTGNTHIKFGLLNDKNEVLHVMELRTDREETADEYAIEIKGLLDLKHIAPDEIEGCVISSVVPTITASLRQAVRNLTGKDSFLLGSGIKTDLEVAGGISTDAIGGDLIAAAVAAKAEYPCPCIIIDMGTATTLTILDENRVFTGGAIMPGVNISLQALVDRTSLLPGIELVPPKKVISLDTVECMRCGLVYGNAGALDGIIDRFRQELKNEPAIIATGGLAKVIAPYCHNAVTIDNDLLLKGLGIIYQLNQK